MAENDTPYGSIFEIPVPGDLTGQQWEDRLFDYQRQGRSVEDVLEIAEHLAFKHSFEGRATAEKRSKNMHLDRQEAAQRASGYPVLMPSALTSRKGYLDASNEDAYLTRSRSGTPRLRLINIGDRLAIWSPVNGGALINPKGAGLRRFGLVVTYARGTDHYATSYKAADLRPGSPS